MPVEKVEAVAQGRVWDGGTARQLGLVDEFGGLESALAWAAAKAGTKDGAWHAVYLGEDTENYDSLIRQLVANAAVRAPAVQNGDLFAMTAARSESLGARLSRDADRLLGTRGIQAFCVECPASLAAPRPPSEHPEGMVALLAWLSGS
jgi:protease-4